MSEPPDPTPATLPDNSGFGLNLLTIAAAVIIAAACLFGLSCTLLEQSADPRQHKN
jgi:hypothetical protein